MIQTVDTKNRLLYNRAILDKLRYVVESHPYLRFGQILIDCDILKTSLKGIDEFVVEDPFNEESEAIWDKMINNKLCFPNE